MSAFIKRLAFWADTQFIASITTIVATVVALLTNNMGYEPLKYGVYVVVLVAAIVAVIAAIRQHQILHNP